MKGNNKEIYDILRLSRCIHDFERYVGLAPASFYFIIKNDPKGTKLREPFNQYLEYVLKSRGLAKPSYPKKSDAAKKRKNVI